MPTSDTYQWTTSSSTGSLLVTNTTSSTAVGSVSMAPLSGHGVAKADSEVEKAVYAHIQAVRALGRDTITTVEIATALSIPQEAVIAAVHRLRSKGVRIAA